MITGGQKPEFANGAETLKALTADNFEPLRAVYLPEEGRGKISAREQTNVRIVPRGFSAQRIGMEVIAEAPAMVDVGDPEVLATCAADVGMDEERVQAFLDSNEGLAEVRDDFMIITGLAADKAFHDAIDGLTQEREGEIAPGNRAQIVVPEVPGDEAEGPELVGLVPQIIPM